MSLMSLSLRASDSPSDSLARKMPIELNGADWGRLSDAFTNAGSRVVSIVHIGDSHLQAETPTMRLRKKFQQRFGSGGRGLISPLKLSGIYQPSDYVISSTGSWSPAKFLRYPWPHTMGFSGTALRPLQTETDLTISTEQEFDDVQIFHAGNVEITNVTDGDGRQLDFVVEHSRDGWTAVTLDRPLTAVTIYLRPSDDFILHCAMLTDGNPGVIYDVIGNGGSDMAMYNRVPALGKGVSRLYPDLIILALGTNDSYNNFSEERFARTLDNLVKELRSANPDAEFLLVTPMEIQYPRTITVKKQVRGRRGKLRTVNQKIKQRQVVKEIAPLRNIILDYAKRNNIAVYDWYAVTGGEGASRRWVDGGLMRTDHIHLTSAGYGLHADMLFDAILDALKMND